VFFLPCPGPTAVRIVLSSSSSLQLSPSSSLIRSFLYCFEKNLRIFAPVVFGDAPSCPAPQSFFSACWERFVPLCFFRGLFATCEFCVFLSPGPPWQNFPLFSPPCGLSPILPAGVFFFYLQPSFLCPQLFRRHPFSQPARASFLLAGQLVAIPVPPLGQGVPNPPSHHFAEQFFVVYGGLFPQFRFLFSILHLQILFCFCCWPVCPLFFFGRCSFFSGNSRLDSHPFPHLLLVAFFFGSHIPALGPCPSRLHRRSLDGAFFSSSFRSSGFIW